MKKNSNIKKGLVYLWCIYPVIGAALMFLMLFIDTTISPIIAPVYDISLVGILAIALSFFATGCAGYCFAAVGKNIFFSAVIANIIPIASVIGFSVLAMIGQSESMAALLLGECGNGLFSILSLYIIELSGLSLSIYESYLSFSILMCTFIVGYSLGNSRRKK